MEQFKRALAINLGGHKYCAPLLESTGLCQGIWFVDLISARSTLSVLVKSAPDETAALYQMSMTEENMRSFLEDEIGVSDTINGIFGFVDQFSDALKWGLRIDDSSWTAAKKDTLPLLLQFDFSKGKQKKGSSMLEGCLRLPLVQNGINLALYDMVVGINSIRTAPSFPANEHSEAALVDLHNSSEGAAEDMADKVHAEAKKRKRAGKQGGVNLFPTRR